MEGRKRNSCFAITFNHVEWDKTCFGEWLLAGGLAKRIVVAQEDHHSALDPLSGELMNDEPGRHQHSFVEFSERYFLREIRDIILEFLCGEERSFDIQVTMFIRYYVCFTI